MALARVQIAEDKAKFVKSLRASEDEIGLFQTYGDILTLAAVLGFNRKRRLPLNKASGDPSAVLQEQFRNGMIISLIAAAEIQESKILSSSEEDDRMRVQIFQEYANGGLEILQNELRGVTDHLSKISLLLDVERHRNESKEEFDLSLFL